MNNIYVTRASLPTIDEYMEEIRDIWETHQLSNMGLKHEKLRDELKAYLGVDNIELLTNGHMALELALQALNLEGEVITTPFTFVSTIHAIIRNGLKPVFCDIDPDNYTIDVSKIEQLITNKTCAILPVHVYGNICNVDEIQRVAENHGLKVIYDAAHAFGEVYKGKGVGSFGDVSCFSFHATKVYNTAEGGAVCYKDSDFGKKIYQLKNFGIKNEEEVECVGLNCKMNELCAALGLCNLRYVDENIKKRKDITTTYNSYLGNMPGIKINHLQTDLVGNYAYYPIVIGKDYGMSRDELNILLRKHGIYSRKYFYPLASSFSCYNKMFDINLTPIAYQISQSVLTLPLYPDLSIDSVERICELIINRN